MSARLRVLIVDDEPLARRRLARMLARHEDVVVVGEAGDGVEARSAIDAHAPDLVLLDIAMPGVDGLTLARGGDMPAVVFTTAHSEHAVTAFELAAVDYLLKPVDEAGLTRALTRVRSRVPVDPGALERVVQALLTAKSGAAAPPQRLAARVGSALHFFDARAIPRLRAGDKYVSFMKDGVEHLLDESLADLEARLTPLGFLRVHRAELVNLHAVASLVGTDEGAELVLTDGQRVPVSRRSLPLVRTKLGL